MWKLFRFLDAKHLFKRACPSVRPLLIFNEWPSASYIVRRVSGLVPSKKQVEIPTSLISCAKNAHPLQEKKRKKNWKSSLGK